VHRLITQMTRHDCQHAHELRRKECEILRLQERLRQSLGISRSVTREVINEKRQENSRTPACKMCGSSISDASSNSQGESAM